LLYDSVFLASEDVLQNQRGRKAVVLLSDGVDHGSKKSLDAAIRAAQRADTIVYSVYFAGEEGGNHGGWGQGQGRGGGPWGGSGGRHGGVGFPGGGYPGSGGGGGGGRYPRQDEPKVDGKKILERISNETGGRMFEVTKKQTVEQIYQQIESELRNQYSLGYTPDRKGDAGTEYHKIRLTTSKKDLTVQARDGYYTPAQKREPAEGK
jgi:VWFA-related protein